MKKFRVSPADGVRACGPLRRLARCLCLVLALSAGASTAGVGATVAIVKGDDPNRMVGEALNLLGVEDLFRDGENVVIKPNLTCYRSLPPADANHDTYPERMHVSKDPNLTFSNYYKDRITPGICTKVEVTRAVANYVKGKARCNLTLAEGSGKDAGVTFHTCGYDELAREMGIPFVDFGADRLRTVYIDGLARMDYSLPVTALDCDVLIDVPVLKTHALCGISVGMKNLFALLPIPREDFHDQADEAICDLVQIRKPDLTVVDGLVGMEGQGPIWGTSVPMGLVVAGRDVVAVDAVCAAIMGIDPNHIAHLVFAAKRGLGEMDLSKITIKGLPIEQVCRPFREGLWHAAVRRPWSQALFDRIWARADSNSHRQDAHKVEFTATFKPSRVKIDSQKRPGAKPYSVFVRYVRDSNTISFMASEPVPFRENIKAVQEEMDAWIKTEFEGGLPCH